MKRFFLFVLFSLFLSLASFSQDTLVVLQYNLLNYGNYTSYCTSGNNNVSKKDGYIQTIVQYVKPDIFSVNEMVAEEAMMEHLRGKLNNTWTNQYKRPAFISENADYIANTIYYNSEKLGFHSQYIAQTFIRDVNIYKFYYRSPSLKYGDTDTIFLYCVVAHLKAGSDSYDTRKIMAENTMNYIAGLDPEANYLLMGDFNLYSDQEQAWKAFTMNNNNIINFNDPVNQSGHWHNNSQYSDYHTQSTHASFNSCAAGGGMDDRFDFILISNDIKKGSKRIQYVANSYWAVGQDGKHFNKSILDAPTNHSVPSEVLTALYKNSDHLPVTLKLAVGGTIGIEEQKNTSFGALIIVNPVNNKLLKASFYSNRVQKAILTLYDFTGKRYFVKVLHASKGKNTFSFPLETLSSGIYIVKLTDEKGFFKTAKVIIP